MSLSPRALADIPEPAVTLGRHVHAEGRASAKLQPGFISAVVRDGTVHAVILRRSGDRLVASCNCAEPGARLLACRHAVAAALAADERGLLGPEPVARLVASESDEAPEPLAALAPAARRPAHAPQAALPLVLSTDAIGRLRVAALAPAPDAELEPAPARHARAWRPLIGPSSEDDAERVPAHRSERIARSDIRFVLTLGPAGHDDRIEIDVAWRRPRRAGDGHGTWMPLSLRAAELDAVTDLPVRHALALLASTQADARDTRSMREIPHHARLPGAAAPAVLECLARTGRLLASPLGAGDAPPLAWDDARWELAVVLERARRGTDLALGLRLERGDESRPLKDAVAVLPQGLVIFRDRIARLATHGLHELARDVRTRGPVPVAATEDLDLVERLHQAAPRARVIIPEGIGLPEVAPVPRHELVLRPFPGDETTHVGAELAHDYDGLRADDATPALVLDRVRRRLVRRDPAAEAAAEGVLREAGARPRRLPDGPDRTLVAWRLRATKVPALVRALVAAGWRVQAEGRLCRKMTSAQARVTTGIDWLELQAEATFGEATAGLPALLAGARRGGGLVRLGDGSVGVLPEEWVARLRPLAELGARRDGVLRFERSQAGLLDALLAELPEIAPDEAFAATRRELRRFGGAQPADPPDSFRGRLREYQREGLGWMKALRRLRLGGVLADDMGLGKTVQVLALLAGLPGHRAGQPSLVVAPRSLVFNWRDEAARFAPGLKVLDHSGTGRTMDAEELTRHDIVLTTYGTLRRDVEMLRHVPFDVVVLDEAQAVKNRTSATAKAVRLLRAGQRLALSGTPVENHLGELWSLFDFLNPGMLGKASSFERIMQASREEDAASLSLLAASVRPFVLRRTKKQVAPELPDRIELNVHCVLGTAQRRLYDQLRDHYRSLAAHAASEGPGWMLAALLRLRQAACHPGLVDPRRRDEPSAKLDLLIPELQEVVSEGHAALVFSQFTTLLDIVADRLAAAGLTACRLDGSTPPLERQEQVRRFQAGEHPLFLISLKAGGTGLNLTRAEYVFLLDPWWNPAAEAQAIDRAHRIGQQRTVIAHRLVAENTVEERVLELQSRKRALADAIIAEDAAGASRLTREDLELLLS